MRGKLKSLNEGRKVPFRCPKCFSSDIVYRGGGRWIMKISCEKCGWTTKYPQTLFDII